MDDELKREIERSLPRDKPIVVMCAAEDDNAFRMAADIHRYLKEQGFPLVSVIGVAKANFDPPVDGCRIELEEHGAKFIVGRQPR